MDMGHFNSESLQYTLLSTRNKETEIIHILLWFLLKLILYMSKIIHYIIYLQDLNYRKSPWIENSSFSHRTIEHEHSCETNYAKINTEVEIKSIF